MILIKHVLSYQLLLPHLNNMLLLRILMEVKDKSFTLNTFDWRLLLTSIGVMSSLFTKGNTEGIKASSRTTERKSK